MPRPQSLHERLRARRRYKKKVEKDEDYVRQIKNLGDAVQQSIMQNYAIDIYQVQRSCCTLAGLSKLFGIAWSLFATIKR